MSATAFYFDVFLSFFIPTLGIVSAAILVILVYVGMTYLRDRCYIWLQKIGAELINRG